MDFVHLVIHLLGEDNQFVEEGREVSHHSLHVLEDEHGWAATRDVVQYQCEGFCSLVFEPTLQPIDAIWLAWKAKCFSFSPQSAKQIHNQASKQ